MELPITQTADHQPRQSGENCRPKTGEIPRPVDILVGIAEQTERQSPLSEAPAVAARDRTGGVEGPVLPGAVGIGRAQDFLRTFQLFGHLDEPVRLPAASIETAPVGLSRCNSTFGELISFVCQTGVSDPEGPVPVVRHAVVTEAIHMVD